MFTIEQILQAHAKVKSGKDFPAYILEIKKMGVTGYETYVTDGHTDFYGNDNFRVSTQKKYDNLAIENESDPHQFANDLKAHQQGQTDYKTFCTDCANSGIEKWVVDTDKMTCTYFDTKGNEILSEKIPS